MLTQKRVSDEQKETLLTFNNGLDETLRLCVYNMGEFTISLEMEIKFGHLLNTTEKIPTIENYQELLDNLDVVELKMETGNSYFV